ncbi:hypothetical protein CB0940_02931 [Cercospora beticola]|uniref:Uncharacterized protein n=1 Tax=Cercospora beticola TaxID=122368 RepID=A0A2G5I467_CERBT|nr:hypothetical protein CB0940_02931 [Cercospora beticola]PIA99283.1 hypothetical protein CB0940_02931 [Cercospora beticola]WPB00085.1 hypothetical protein RHO25_004704 [Cercospora beticola]CAK1361732.1 unnamed protein product [Cercospora beticola]
MHTLVLLTTALATLTWARDPVELKPFDFDPDYELDNSDCKASEDLKSYCPKDSTFCVSNAHYGVLCEDDEGNYYEPPNDGPDYHACDLEEAEGKKNIVSFTSVLTDLPKHMASH